MTVYIILFRGVGGATQLPTKPLREALTEAGSRTSPPTSTAATPCCHRARLPASVMADVAKITKEEFGFDKAIYAVTREEWGEADRQQPVSGRRRDSEVPARRRAGRQTPDKESVDALRAFARAGERIEVVGKVAYLHTPDGFGTSKLAEKFDKGIGVPNTARNWNTVIALAKMADAIK